MMGSCIGTSLGIAGWAFPSTTTITSASLQSAVAIEVTPSHRRMTNRRNMGMITWLTAWSAVVMVVMSASKHCAAFTPGAPQWATTLASIRGESDTSSSTSALHMGFLSDLFSNKSNDGKGGNGRTSGFPKVKAPDGFVAPEPQPFTITKKIDLVRFIKTDLSLFLRIFTGFFTLGWTIDTFSYDDEANPDTYCVKLGPWCIREISTVLDQAPRPEQPLILYEYEASPFCKRVRETMNLLDINVEYRPCPGARQGFSDELMERTGRRTVPYLVDPNTKTEMFESNDQIEYLLQTYGPPADTYDRKALWPITFEAFSLATSALGAVLLDFPGGRRQPNARPDNEQMQVIELWGYEWSPFVKIVREKLCALCVPHRIISCARGSTKRDDMIRQYGRFQVPLLVDPNTGVEMFEAPEIVEYLEAVYTVNEDASSE